jgi:NADH-quinone oxidoreductase subunit N
VNSPVDVATVVGVFRLIFPELILGAAACVLFLGATFRSDRDLWAGFSLVSILVAALALVYGPTATGESADRLLPFVNPTVGALHSAVLIDPLAVFTKAIALAGGLVLVLLSWKSVPARQAGEYYACLLLIVAGVCLTGAANELVTLFLALELISIPTYVILYLPRHDSAAQEAALKYFLLSIFSSGFLLFGFSYLYGFAGTTNLPDLFAKANINTRPGSPVLLAVAAVMVVAGIGFRITAVPFHFYAPDVYQGSATPVAALLAFFPKLAGFVTLLRVLGYITAGQMGTGLELGNQVPMLLYFLAVATMSLGNLLALLQENVKRILAYSSVAHAGYMLIGLAVAPDLLSQSVVGGVDALLFYLVAYGAMTIGAFAVLEYVSTPERPAETVDDLAGLSGSNPGVALLMGLFLFSLIGMPLTAGFAGKLMLFFGALAVPPPRDFPWLFRILALIGAVNAAIGGWYYLRIIAAMYLRTAMKPLTPARSLPGMATLWLCAAATLILGVYPTALSQVTRAITHSAEPARQVAKR